jgi:hypothetical protein
MCAGPNDSWCAGVDGGDVHEAMAISNAQLCRPRINLVSGPVNDAGHPIAWPALAKGTPVYASDGQELGRVSSVVADEQKDIFSGVAFKPGLFDNARFAPAELVAELTSTAVRLAIRADEAERLEDYQG